MPRPQPGLAPGSADKALKGAAKIAEELKKPFTEEVKEKAKQGFCKHSLPAFRNKTSLALGAVIAADGLRRIFNKDAQKEDKGKRIKAIAQTAVGIGVFTAAVLSNRNQLPCKPGLGK